MVEREIGVEQSPKSRGAGIIFYIEPTNELLFFLRDDKPTISCPGMIDIIGGHMEPGEEPLETAIREVGEELFDPNTNQPFEIDPSSVKLFDSFVDDRPGEHNIFVSRLSCDPSLATREGQGLVRLNPEEARTTNFAYGYNEVVNKFVDSLDQAKERDYSKPFIAGIEDAEKFERPGFDGLIQVSAEQGLGFTALTILVHGEHPRKRIIEGTRTYYVVEGSGAFKLNEEEKEVTQGDLLVIPEDGEYSYRGEMTLFEMNIPKDLSVQGKVIDEKLDD